MGGETELRVWRLEPTDDRSRFDSGDADLDRFSARFAGQNQFRHHIGTTYVAELAGHILGFVTVSVGEIASEGLSKTDRKKLPAYPLPILRIARLAVDRRYQRQGIGKLLLKAMFELALELRENVGCIGVVVDTRPQAIPFYRDLGFRALDLDTGQLAERPMPVPRFLPLRLVEQARG